MRKLASVHKITHMGISVQGVLKNFKRKKITFCSHDDGREMTDAEARAVFLKADYEGKKLLPMSGECYRFDDQKGCLGHILSIMPNEEGMLIIENEMKSK